MTADKRQAYEAGGKAAYQFGYDGNAAVQPQRWEDVPARRRKSQRRRRTAKSMGLQVREPGKIAPFAVLGLLVACFMVVLMLCQYANLVEINDSAVGLRKSMEILKADEAKLLAQYELAYDLQAIEQEMLASGEMIKAQSGQFDRIELTHPDSAQYHQDGGFGKSFLNAAKQIVSAIGSYF